MRIRNLFEKREKQKKKKKKKKSNNESHPRDSSLAKVSNSNKRRGSPPSSLSSSLLSLSVSLSFLLSFSLFFSAGSHKSIRANERRNEINPIKVHRVWPVVMGSISFPNSFQYLRLSDARKFHSSININKRRDKRIILKKCKKKKTKRKIRQMIPMR